MLLPLHILVIVTKPGWLLKNEAGEHGVAFFCATYHHLFSKSHHYLLYWSLAHVKVRSLCQHHCRNLETTWRSLPRQKAEENFLDTAPARDSCDDGRCERHTKPAGSHHAEARRSWGYCGRSAGKVVPRPWQADPCTPFGRFSKSLGVAQQSWNRQ